MDPSAWMERLRQGDREALEPLLAHYEGMLRYIVSGVLSDPHRQEELPGRGAPEAVGEAGAVRPGSAPALPPGSLCCAGTPPWTT